MDRYEAKSNQLISLMSQLSDSRAKAALQKICQDLINIDKKSIKNEATTTNGSSGCGSGSVSSSSSSSSLSVSSTSSSQNLTDTTPLATTTTTITSPNDREIAHLIDSCFDHIKKALLIPEPSIIWKIISYSIAELDYLDRALDLQEKPEKEKFYSSCSTRLEEVSSMLAFLQSSPRNNTREYAELLSGINAHMKKITLRLKGVVEQNQYGTAKKYGWVEKRCGKNQSFRTWKRMWFVLGENEISYFIKDKNVKKKSTTTNNEDLLWSSECIINLEGELGKKKEGKGWKIRYMKLLDHTLVYYKNQREREPLGIINLNDCQDCEVFKENSNKFVVVHSNNRYFFQTSNKEELGKWITSIRARIPSLNTKNNTTKKMDLSQFYLKGAIELARVVSITESHKFSGQPHSISIATEEKHYYFSFDSNREKQEWLSLFNSELSKLNSSQVIKHNSNSNNNIGNNSNTNSNGNGNSSSNSSNWTSSPIQSTKSLASRSSLSLSRQKIETSKLPTLSSTSSLTSNNEEEGSEFGSVLTRRPTLAQIKYTTSSTNLLKHSNGSLVGGSGNGGSNTPISASTSSLANMINSNPDTDQEDSGDDDLKMMIPESLKNEMVKRSALNLLNTFKLEVFLSSNTLATSSSSSSTTPSTSPLPETTFLFSNHVLVDQVKTFIFKRIPALQGLPQSEYRLGIDEENLFEIEFLKFIYSHTMVELTIKTCGIIRVGVFHHRKDRRVKEKLYPDKYQPLSGGTTAITTNGLSNSTGSLPILNNNLRSSVQQQQKQQNSPPDKSIVTPTTSSSINGSNNNSSPFITRTNHSQSVSSPNNWIPSGASSSPSQNSPLLEKKGWQSVNPSPTTSSRRLMISPCNGWNVESPGSNEFTSVGYIPKFNKQEQGFYRRYIFESQGCVQSFLGIDAKIGPMAFSLVKDLMDNYRGVLHTKSGAKTISEESKNINFSTNILSGVSKKMKTKKIVSHMMNLLEPNVDPKLLSLATNQSDLQKELLLLEERQTTSGFKFGLVYCRHGQITDDEIFSNKTGNKDWEEFLDLLGDRIELIGWPHYSAGLDVRNNTTGTHSLYTDYHGNEVMFHVSTMLPFSSSDHQQIERKRQIGNDICVVVFNDGTLSYSPGTITSHFNHVVIVVQLDKQNNGYKVSMACKDGVKIPFEPVTPNGSIIKKNDIKDFILTKLINGELASLQAPVFSSKISRTRESLLNYYVEQFL